MTHLKIIGMLDPKLAELLISGGYELDSYHDPGDFSEDDLEGITPVILGEVRECTARALKRGLEQDSQATQRFILAELLASPDDEKASLQQLKSLTDYTQVLARTLVKREILDSTMSFLHYVLGADWATIHQLSSDSSYSLVASIGVEPATAALIGDWFGQLSGAGVDLKNSALHSESPPPLTMTVPIVAGSQLWGWMTIREGLHFGLTLESLQAMGQMLALALQNGELQQRFEQAVESLKQAQQNMSQSEKLAAVGMLAAGIAHEINNPAAFIMANLSVLRDYAQDLFDYAGRLEEALANAQPHKSEWLEALQEELDIEYLREDTPKLIERSLNGMTRIHDIVRDMKSFAHRGDGLQDWVDINQIVSQVIKIAGAELRHRAKLELDLRPLPLVRLESTKLLQVLLNLAINAYQSFGERDPAHNQIWIGTCRDASKLRVFVADNGCGFSEEVRDRLFEPFFTTKPVGTGTGLGLAISYEIVRAMQGRILVQSTQGRGSRFTVELALTDDPEIEPGLRWMDPEEGLGSE